MNDTYSFGCTICTLNKKFNENYCEVYLNINLKAWLSRCREIITISVFNEHVLSSLYRKKSHMLLLSFQEQSNAVLMNYHKKVFIFNEHDCNYLHRASYTSVIITIHFKDTLCI